MPKQALLQRLLAVSTFYTFTFHASMMNHEQTKACLGLIMNHGETRYISVTQSHTMMVQTLIGGWPRLITTVNHCVELPLWLVSRSYQAWDIWNPHWLFSLLMDNLTSLITMIYKINPHWCLLVGWFWLMLMLSPCFFVDFTAAFYLWLRSAICQGRSENPWWQARPPA